MKALLGNLEVSAVGWLPDLERQGSGFQALMAEAEQLFSMTASIGGQAVEILNGPLDWRAVDAFRRARPMTATWGSWTGPWKSSAA